MHVLIRRCVLEIESGTGTGTITIEALLGEGRRLGASSE